MKEFYKVFAVTFLLFTVALIPVHAVFQKVADTPIFTAKENLLNEIDSFVDPNSPFFDEFSDKQRVNILLLGLNEGLTDTIMMASFDMEAKHVDLISVPRDTYYVRKGYNSPAEKKINAAYRGTVKNTALAVSDLLLGMPIHYYAVVDYKGVENIVDDIGGVPMNVPPGMHYEDPTAKPPLYIDLKPGQQVLNGKDAVKFIRFRKGNRGGKGYIEGDIGRVKAQQEFMKAAMKQMLSGNVLKATESIFNNVESDITMGMAAKIATKAVGMSGDSITTYMLPSIPDPDPPFYVYPETVQIESMLTDIYSIVATSEGAIREPLMLDD